MELFVLDDGWFGERNDDTAGLGDWVENPAKLPEGIAGDEADEDDGEREQESVHGVAGAEAENRARLLVLNC